MSDLRNVRNGLPISVGTYSDQPYVVKTADGAWLMVVTTGSGHEGSKGQHVVSARSLDGGKTWVDRIDVESPENPESSYAVLYRTDYGRIYCFYNYNAENRRYVLGDPSVYPDGKCVRVDSQGQFVFKYSDDNGKSWSEKWYEIPQRRFAVDLANPYGGEVLYFWNVGKPFTHENGVFVPLYKIGDLGPLFMNHTECVLLHCDNINTERDPERLHWQTLPDGDVGIRTPHEVCTVSEEHSFVVLSDGSFFCVFRTTTGHSYFSYSRDGGHTFTPPERMKYADGREMKHPRAANFIWKCENGKYLYWYHNHGGKSYDGRNPVWLSGAVEYPAPDGMRLKFSEPEILLYDEDVFIRMSYPDFIEQDGEYYFTETQKAVARLHKADKATIEGLWAQLDGTVEKPDGIVLTDGAAMPKIAPFVRRDESRSDHRATDVGGGFAFMAEVTLAIPSDGETLLFSTQNAEKAGARAVWNGEEIVFTMGDGLRTNVFYSDKAPLAGGGRHKIAVSVDADARIVSFVIDGRFCDGGKERQYGFGRFDRYLTQICGSETVQVGDAVEKLTFVPRRITTSEAVAATR